MNLQITGLKVDVGEGSRGGKIIGHTTSGKPIYMNHGHESHRGFDKGEHKEAAKIHEQSALSARSGDPDTLPHIEAMEHHRKQSGGTVAKKLTHSDPRSFKRKSV